MKFTELKVQNYYSALTGAEFVNSNIKMPQVFKNREAKVQIKFKSILNLT